MIAISFEIVNELFLKNLFHFRHFFDRKCEKLIFARPRKGLRAVEALSELSESDGFCSDCFTGKYPTEIPANVFKDRFERRLSWKEN